MSTSHITGTRRRTAAAAMATVCALVLAAACAPPPAAEPAPLVPAPTGWVEPTTNLVGHADLPTPNSTSLRLVSFFPLGDGVATLSTTGEWAPGGTNRRARLLALDATGRLTASLDLTGALAGARPASPTGSPPFAVMGDGRVVISLGSELLMLGPDGRPVTTWGLNGRAVAPGWTSTASAPVTIGDVLVQPDGSVVLAAFQRVASGSARFALSRVDPDGLADPGFGGSGGVELAAPAGAISNPRVRLDRDPVDGSIIVAWSNDDTTAVRSIDADGAPDDSFTPYTDLVTGQGCGGCRTLADVRTDSTGRVWVATLSQIVRLLPDGSLDPSFDGDGRLDAHDGRPLPLVSTSSTLEWQDDRMLVASSWLNVRLLEDGSLDPSIGAAVVGGIERPGYWVTDRVEPEDGSINVVRFGYAVRNGGLFAAGPVGTAQGAYWSVTLARGL